MKWKKKFCVLFDREKVINFGPQHKNHINFNKLEFSVDRQTLTPLKQLGAEILSMAKFWILYLTLVGKGKTSIMLENGLEDLAVYGVENTYDNRIMMSEFLPEGFD